MISNIQETLLMYTKQKNRINAELSGILMDMMNATRENSNMQVAYNEKLQELYYDPEVGYGTEEYEKIVYDMQNEHEIELAELDAWESELELEKNNCETQLNEVTSFESSWSKLLQNNIKGDFTYGSNGQ